MKSSGMGISTQKVNSITQIIKKFKYIITEDNSQS